MPLGDLVEHLVLLYGGLQVTHQNLHKQLNIQPNTYPIYHFTNNIIHRFVNTFEQGKVTYLSTQSITWDYQSINQSISRPRGREGRAKKETTLSINQSASCWQYLRWGWAKKRQSINQSEETLTGGWSKKRPWWLTINQLIPCKLPVGKLYLDARTKRDNQSISGLLASFTWRPGRKETINQSAKRWQALPEGRDKKRLSINLSISQLLASFTWRPGQKAPRASVKCLELVVGRCIWTSIISGPDPTQNNITTKFNIQIRW